MHVWFSLCVFVHFSHHVLNVLVASQAFQSEHGGPAVVLREVHLLRPVCLSDPLWLPYQSAGQLPHQELQLSQPLPLPRVSVYGVSF